MTCFSFVILAFVLGIWAGFGWSAAALRSFMSENKNLEVRIKELEGEMQEQINRIRAVVLRDAPPGSGRIQ